MLKTYTLNHFGLVAGTCKELRIAEIIDSVIPPDPQQKVTTGQAVVAMIINGLGFSNRPLYLFPQFFENKPVELLIGKNITAESLNDDIIGRALDRVFNYGCTELFCYIASAASEISGVDNKFGHLDTTTFSVYGEYESSEGAVIQVTHGYSKMKRPDLKQVVVNLLVSSDGGVPFYMQTLDGNSNDSTVIRNTLKEFKKGLRKNLQKVTYWIADSKFYCEDTLKEVKDDFLWISRVPTSITEAKDIIEATANSLEDLEPIGREGYSYRKYESNYADVSQRWLIIHSEKAKERAIKTVKNLVEKEFEALKNQANKIQRKEYYCEADALRSNSLLQKKSKYHTINIEQIKIKEKYKRRGRPSKNKNNEKIILYYPNFKINADTPSVELEIDKRSIFIVATNETSEKNLSDLDVFDNYKGQKNVERGFRFLKDPLFFASSLFLKKPERIVSLTMIMCLSLLVYSLCERKLRNTLKELKETVNNQLGKPTSKPTLRWIYQLFEDVHYAKYIDGDKVKCMVKNLRPDGEKCLRILGESYMAYYLLD